MKTQYQSWQEKSLTYGCLLRGLIINAVIFVALGAGILWVMNAQNMIQGPWASLFTVAFVILGVMFAFLQWFFPRSPIESKTSIYTSETTITPTSGQSIDSARTNIFIHKVTIANRLRHFTYINHPLANDNPYAIVLVTHNWSPPGKPAEIYNNHHIGVWYDEPTGQWSIYNEDKTEMAIGMTFNVVVFDKPDSYPSLDTPGSGMGVYG